MKKVILLTGATDGIGLETAKKLLSMGHLVLIHGRNVEKLTRLEKELSTLPNGENVESYVADLSRISDVESLANAVAAKHNRLDVLINNAGVYSVPEIVSADGLDSRFVVNTIAPYLLTKRLLPLFDNDGRVVNLSSAAQSPVDLKALATTNNLPDGLAYAQSKLALTMWSKDMANSLKDQGPAIIAVNPKSLLGSKMVKEAYGVAGGDLSIGAEILARAALSEEFANASGQYFDNDIGQFSAPHPDALDLKKCNALTQTIELILTKCSS